jgi:hypothetical protein
VSYELSIQEKEGYLHFQVTGDNDKETVQNYLAAIYEECVRRGISKILVEENLRGPGLRVLDIFRIAEEGGLSTGSGIKRVAYVDANPEHSYSDMRFATTVASNRGLNVQLFSTVQAAEEWLRLTLKEDDQSEIRTN